MPGSRNLAASLGHPCAQVQAVFRRRKNGLLRRAMELSVLSDCDVAVLVFHGTTGEQAAHLFHLLTPNHIRPRLHPNGCPVAVGCSHAPHASLTCSAQ